MIFPNRENIDRWLFDYTEGNLSADQEFLLENYILNNPDLEVDLEAWQDAKIEPIQYEFSGKEKLKKRRKLLPFYFLGILLFIFSVGTYSILSIHNEKVEITSSKDSTKPFIGRTNKSTRAYNSQFNPITKYNVKERFLNPITNRINSQNKLNLDNYNFEANSENHSNSIVIASSFDNHQNISELSDESQIFLNNSISTKSSQIKLNPIELSSLQLNHYQIRNEELHTIKVDDKNEVGSLNIRKIKILHKIERMLEKDLGLSNIPDHTYALPEYSNIDVLFSNIGSTSQFRFQSVSSARWIESETQRKFAQQISLDGYSRGAQSGFGLQANYDYFANGSIQNWNTCLLFSPKIALTKSISFEPAMRFKIGNKILRQERIENHSNVTYESFQTQQFNFDTSLAIGNKLWYRDLDLGFTINTPYFYLGGQVKNVLRHHNNIYSNYENLDLRAINEYNAIIGTQYISRNQKIQFSPYVFLENRNYQNKFFGGFSLKLNKLLLGGSYGTGNTISAIFGLSTQNFSLFAQSSHGNSIAFNSPSYTHQLTLRINSNVDKKSRRYITF